MSIITRYLNNKSGMENIQTMIIVSTVLFIYEISLYYFNVIPTIRRIIKRSLKKINVDITPIKINEYISKDNIALLIPMLEDNIVLDTLEVLKERESILIKKINNYTIASASLFLILLIILIYIMHRKQSINMNVVVMTSIILLLIFGFQYLFYLFGQKYKYISSVSEDELNYLVLKNL
jgi:hypothetical protein